MLIYGYYSMQDTFILSVIKAIFNSAYYKLELVSTKHLH